jgi:hypothetical protein
MFLRRIGDGVGRSGIICGPSCETIPLATQHFPQSQIVLSVSLNLYLALHLKISSVDASLPFSMCSSRHNLLQGLALTRIRV